MALPERPPILARPGEANSLFGEILDWMLAPLLLLWPISIAATHHVANELANQPYDQALAQNVEAIARLVRADTQKVVVNLPGPARTILHADDEDTTYLQVRNAKGEILAGDSELPAIPDEEAKLGETQFRDERIAGEPIRVAYRSLVLEPGQRQIQIQVAETLKKRQALASRMISGVLLPQFAIIPMAVVLVWLGLSRGLAPLNRLRHRLAERRPGDLSPLRTRGVPEELQPMIRSFNDLLARLEENLHAQERFIADAAHQMKTPLTGLRMQAELAASETDPVQLRRSVEQIAHSAEQASHLIHQLLTLARAESSHDKVHKFEAADLAIMAREAVGDWVSRALAKDIDLGFEERQEPLLIEAVPLLVRQMVDNLIDNAIKYTPTGGRVTISVFMAGESARIDVVDSGIGIPNEDRERVFERFYRVLGTGAEGSGLGLPICAEIAELHRARITLGDGDNGGGTRVSVVFPLSPQALAQLLQEQPPSPTPMPLA